MENKGESTSPEVRVEARQLSRLVWSIVLVMVGVVIGLLAARSQNAAE